VFFDGMVFPYARVMDKGWRCLDGRSVETNWDDYKYETVLVGILGVIRQIPVAHPSSLGAL
jgi:hypothetical protein